MDDFRDGTVLVPNSGWYFCPTDSRGGYHENFNRNNFESRFAYHLLPNLHKLSLIILDKTKYHWGNQKYATVPTKMQKEEVFRKSRHIDIPFDLNSKMLELTALLRNRTNSNDKKLKVWLTWQNIEFCFRLRAFHIKFHWGCLGVYKANDC